MYAQPPLGFLPIPPNFTGAVLGTRFRLSQDPLVVGPPPLLLWPWLFARDSLFPLFFSPRENQFWSLLVCKRALYGISLLGSGDYFVLWTSSNFFSVLFPFPNHLGKCSHLPACVSFVLMALPQIFVPPLGSPHHLVFSYVVRGFL